MALRPKQRKLFGSLCALEQERTRLSRPELIAHLVLETGYPESTVATYLTKYLERHVRLAPDDRFDVRGVRVMAEDEFGTLMAQKRQHGEAEVLRYESRDEWLAAMRALARHGIERAYQLDAGDLELVGRLLPEPAAARPSTVSGSPTTP